MIYVKSVYNMPCIIQIYSILNTLFGEPYELKWNSYYASPCVV
jgi:hypothetical protein